MNRFFYVILFLSFLPFTGIAQPVTPSEELDYIIEEFTLPGGRLGNNVNSIVQGPYGFMWFGSHGGLHRYDGYEIKTYKNVPSDTIGESTSLTFPYIESLYWDKSDMLWVTTYGGGLYRFDPTSEIFKHYAHDPDDSTTISHPRVLCAVEDAEGQMWFGTENGLNLFDLENESFTRYYANPEDPKALLTYDIRNLYVDSNGTLWIATGFIWDDARTGALSRYDPATDSFENYNVFDPIVEDDTLYSPIRGLHEDSRGNFWVGNAKGLYKMDRQTNTFQKMVYDPEKPHAPGAADRSNPIVFSILEDKKGGLWIGTIFDYNYKSHLLRYNPNTESSQIFPVESAAWQIFESRDGTIWVAGAGDTGKVLQIKTKPKTYDLTIGSSVREQFFSAVVGKVNQAFIFDHAIDPGNGTLWGELGIVFDQDSLLLALANYNPISQETEFHLLHDLDFDESLDDFQWNSMGLLIDRERRIWGSIHRPDVGIYRYDLNTKVLKQFLHDPEDSSTISSNEVLTLMLDSRGEIWAATNDSGLNRINPESGIIKQYHFNQGEWSNSDRPFAMFEGIDGKIWVAGELILSDGTFAIVTIDPKTNEMQKIRIPSEYTFGVISMMVQSPLTGKVMFVLGNNSNGIGFFDPENGNFSFYSTDDGTFPMENISAIAASLNGDFWVSSFDGTFVQITKELDFFSYPDGSRVGTIWRSGLSDENGNVYFLDNTSGGWKKIDPSVMIPEVFNDPMEIRLVELSVMGQKQQVNSSWILQKPLWLNESISLPSEAQSFELRFSDFDFQHNSPLVYYRLYPFEENWVRAGNTPVASYYRVPTGDYTFQVKTQSGPLKDHITELKIVILPPWWMTWWAYVMYGLIFVIGVFVVDRYQRKRLLTKANAEAKEKELKQAREIEKAYNELKTTQEQLIQSEKMASLGELTAGIAHEIQNPLNFVNNFSDVNSELVDELKEEIDKGNTKEAKAIADDIAENEKKIMHHGKRAEEIVKSMLQHSRGSEGKKEPTEINALADEYLRLAYHGMRAKDKSFNVTMETGFDPTIGTIEVVPQDMGRVILNLITNAFFALSQKREEHIEGYEPVIHVSTKKAKDKIEIRIKDNGSGIPIDVVNKIFQPFFSTKGTGKGTGLGLSLSYDIITKGHGGSIEVESNEGEGTEFKIFLPVK